MDLQEIGGAWTGLIWLGTEIRSRLLRTR
jgi:hypothetical protein